MASMIRLPQAHRSPREKQPTMSFQPMNSFRTAQPTAPTPELAQALPLDSTTSI
ncbi:hypothetical protein [Streptomyces albus]|uniref:hypothetical protein n=1 Tax=Streptomyces albus TaxID=1888 RepID=UPI00131AC3E7|nr:hypothetical protein [Streptomyces albus]